MSAEAEIRAMVDRETEAWNQLDASALVDLFHPDMVWPWPPDSRAHDPAAWVFPQGRFDRERWQAGWEDLLHARVAPQPAPHHPYLRLGPRVRGHVMMVRYCSREEEPMPSELSRIDEQLRLSFEGGAWHGPALLEVLDGLGAEAACAHPIDGAHSAWEVVLHIGDAPLVAGAPATAYTQFIGMTQDTLYHAGQIVLLERALSP